MISVDEIAKTERLTRDVLLREILPHHNESSYFKEKKKELLSDLGSISSEFDLDERVIIYCFMCLWSEGKVPNFDFWKSYNENRLNLVRKYQKQYYADIAEVQKTLWND